MFKENMADKEIFSGRLKSLRKERGFKTQTEFAEAFDKKYNRGVYTSVLPSVKKWESSENECFPDINSLMRLCDFLGCDSDFLLGLQDHPKKEIEKAAEFIGLSYDAMEKVSKYTYYEKDTLEQLILSNDCLYGFLKVLYIGSKNTLYEISSSNNSKNARERKEFKSINDMDQLEYYKYMKYFENFIEKSGCINNILNSLLSYRIENRFVPTDAFSNNTNNSK